MARPGAAGQIALVTLPVVMLLLFRVVGEIALLLAALLIPVIVAIGSVRMAGDPDESRDCKRSGIRLPGRAEFLVALDAHRSRPLAAPVACLVVRLDSGDQILAERGAHSVSDEMERFVDRLRGVLTQNDVLAQLDDTTLAVASMPDDAKPLESAVQTALRIQRQSDLMRFGSRSATTTIGVALSDRLEEAGPAALLAAAEYALRDAQRSAARTIRFHGAAGAPQPIQIALAHDLANGFDTGRIHPWFQPQISTDTGELTGVEALARWNHPHHGLLTPGDFLPTIEASNAICRLTDTMIDQSLDALATWDQQGCTVPLVSVNFSLTDLRDPALPDRVAWLLDRHEIGAERLGVEVLETVLHHGTDQQVPNNLKALKAMGCLIDLDDFGTGNASITNIRRFSADRIKIDRAFVRDIDTDRDQQGMVAAILTMCEQLGLETLAEGIETPGEYAMVSQLGCGHVQGFGIGRPMEREALPGWLEKLQETCAAASIPAMLRPRPDGSGARYATAPRRRAGRGKTA
ncbi:EAL domain-containing protein [Palleronia aestuarii]|nr:EAL domain-containing protein [Palleronia aestuarii]